MHAEISSELSAASARRPSWPTALLHWRAFFRAKVSRSMCSHTSVTTRRTSLYVYVPLKCVRWRLELHGEDHSSNRVARLHVTRVGQIFAALQSEINSCRATSEFELTRLRLANSAAWTSVDRDVGTSAYYLKMKLTGHSEIG